MRFGAAAASLGFLGLYLLNGRGAAAAGDRR
jgi:hypothetical protein